MSFRECWQGMDEDSGPVEPGWYLAYTRPRMENTAVANLERQGFEVYLPLFKACRNTEAGLQAAFEPMFPRYVFLRPRSARQSLSTIASTRGVCWLVRAGSDAAQVSAETLGGIRDCERQRNDIGLDTISPVQPGARVRMRSRALHGLEGVVVSVARQRVTFLLQLLGREKQITVDHGEIELA